MNIRRTSEFGWRIAVGALAIAVMSGAGIIRPVAGDRGGSGGAQGGNRDRHADAIQRNAATLIAEGQWIFRFDTFGDENFWGGTLRLHETVTDLSPAAVIGLGLKVDRQALSRDLQKAIQKGRVDLTDPVVTRLLLRRNAVVGVKGFFAPDSGELVSIGIQCALCHSTVDDSLAPGIGNRLDGWANRDLNVGAIIASAPDLSFFAGLLGVTEDDVRDVLLLWGPGKFDAQLLLDGQGVQPNGDSAATLIPPAFGLAGVNLHTWTGAWGSVSYWNAFVANLEMQGQGTFFDPRLNDAARFPIAAANGFGDVRSDDDRITAKLPALQLFQLAIPAPEPPEDSYDLAAATRGQALFVGEADCARCHVPPLFTEPGWNLHTAEEIGIDDFQASRAPDDRYRTAPLKGLWTHQKGGFYHDGRFATLTDVVNHYNGAFGLGLAPDEISDLVQYLLSL